MKVKINLVLTILGILLYTQSSYASEEYRARYCSYETVKGQSTVDRSGNLSENYELLPPDGVFCEGVSELYPNQSGLDCRQEIQSLGYSCFQIVKSKQVIGGRLSEKRVCWGCLY